MARKLPRWSRRLLPKRPEVILSATIEYEQTGKQSGMYLGEDSHELNISSKDLEAECKRVIEKRLPEDLEDLFGIEAEIRVRGSRYGSLIVFFSVLLSGYTLIASYRGFYDSIRLIKEHCAVLLNKLLRDRYPHHSFKNVVVKTQHPSLPNPQELYWPSRLWKGLGIHPSEMPWLLGESSPPRGQPRRDGFFWFLLVLCVLLLTALGVLVYAAVVSTYFPEAATLSTGLLL